MNPHASAAPADCAAAPGHSAAAPDHGAADLAQRSASQPPARATPDDGPPPPRTEANLTWSDKLLLGFAPMDDTHREFYQVAFALMTCDDGNAAAALAAFEDHCVQHFEQEEQWMHSTAFPPRDCHIDEHAAVLASVREVRAMVADGRAGSALAQDLAMHLFQWFPGHADYLDSALAAWMSKQTYGGKPVVLRRKLDLG